MNKKIVFLDYLYTTADLKEIISSRTLNLKFETTKIIGSTQAERESILSAIYIQNIKKIPKNNKKKSYIPNLV